ncbi:hypothetical protein ACFQL4_18290 [Halosimplex aquaticum]
MESGLSSLTGQTYAKLIVIRDPYVGEHSHEQRAQLRCLPLLIEHGYDRIIHTDLWDNDFKPVSYTYFDPEDVDPHEIEFPLVHVVSQEGLTEYGEQHLVRSLLKQRSEDDTYIVVSDTNAPRTPAYTTERSFVDEFTPNKGIDYESRVTSYIRDNLIRRYLSRPTGAPKPLLSPDLGLSQRRWCASQHSSGTIRLRECAPEQSGLGPALLLRRARPTGNSRQVHGTNPGGVTLVDGTRRRSENSEQHGFDAHTVSV